MDRTEDDEALLVRIEQLGGFSNREEAVIALEAVLLALGAILVDAERKRLADALPPHARALLAGRAHEGDATELFEIVEEYEGTTVGFAREHAQVVCRALGEVLGDDARRYLEHELPPSLADLFRLRTPFPPPPEPGVLRADAHRTLAAGRPGSRHPLSTSAPPGAQSHSVVREANPHADTKLSSASGTTQERLAESLATHAPDATSRTLSQGRG